MQVETPIRFVEITPSGILHDGDNFTVSGNVGQILSNSIDVTIEIIQPDEDYVSVTYPLIDETGSFSEDFVIDSSTWDEDGTYTVFVTYYRTFWLTTIQYQEIP